MVSNSFNLVFTIFGDFGEMAENIRVYVEYVIFILMDKCMMMMLFVVKFVVVMLEMMVVICWCKEL